MGPERHRIPKACREAYPVLLHLPRASSIKSPDSSPILKLGTGVQPRRIAPAGLLLTGVGGRTDVDVEGAAGAESKALGSMVGVIGEATHQGIGWSRRDNRPSRERVSEDGVIRGEKKVIPAEENLIPAVLPEQVDFVRLPVPVQIAKNRYPSGE